jgi:ribA/ribD-fused uncharacterized protein
VGIIDEHASRYPGLFDPSGPPVLFYGHSYPEWRTLSNFAGTPIVMTHPFSGQRALYPTIEHYFQANKAEGADDHDWVRAAASAAGAKRRGSGRGEKLADGSWRRISLRASWDALRFEIMREALRVKFATPRLRTVLLATGRRYIAEDSPYDATWGWRDSTGGHDGANLLGLALMLVRAELQASLPPT